MNEATTATKTALSTLDSLEARLQKVQWYLGGSEEASDSLQAAAAQGQDHTVQARLARLEGNLGTLSARSPVVRDLLRLGSWLYLSLPFYFSIALFSTAHTTRTNRRFLSRSLPSHHHRRPHYALYAGDPRNRKRMRSVLPKHRFAPQRHQRPARPTGRSVRFADRATSTAGGAGATAR